MSPTAGAHARALEAVVLCHSYGNKYESVCGVRMTPQTDAFSLLRMETNCPKRKTQHSLMIFNLSFND